MTAATEALPIGHGGKRATIAKIARGVLIGAAAIAAVLGAFVTGGRNAPMLPVHELLGDVAVLSLWTLVVLGARAGVPRGRLTLATAWGVLVVVLVGAQRLELSAPMHVLTQIVHVASGAGTVVLGLALARDVLHAKDVPAGSPTIAEAAAEFLAKKRIAITGVSRTQGGSHGANVVYLRLRERGYQVFAVNPHAETVEGDRAYHDLGSIPGGVEAVVIATKPERALDTMRECARLGIRHVWMHRGIGGGSVSPEAAAWGRANGVRVIDGGCPLMFHPVGDGGHKVMRGLLTLTGTVPRRIS